MDELEQRPEGAEPEQDNGDSTATPTASPAAEPTAEAQTEGSAEAERHWYVVHTYSGYEQKVKKNLEHRIEAMGMQGRIFQVIVPTEEEVEMRDGQRRTTARRIFPGYVFVEMLLDEESWYVVRNTPAVTGFVGMGNKPSPLPQAEVDKILHRIESDEPKVKVSFKQGEKVRIKDGIFADFIGVVDALDHDKQKARVMVSFFNRETPVDVDFLQLERA